MRYPNLLHIIVETKKIDKKKFNSFAGFLTRSIKEISLRQSQYARSDAGVNYEVNKVERWGDGEVTITLSRLDI